MKRRYLGKFGWGLAAALFALTLQPTAALAAKGVIKIHEGDWTGNLVDLALVKIILEEEMDYKTKAILLPSGPVVFEAILAGEDRCRFGVLALLQPHQGCVLRKVGRRRLHRVHR